jgi:hypothetical protein
MPASIQRVAPVGLRIGYTGNKCGGLDGGWNWWFGTTFMLPVLPMSPFSRLLRVPTGSQGFPAEFGNFFTVIKNPMFMGFSSKALWSF